MKKSMTTLATLMLAALANTGQAHAADVIFDASQDCQARDTTQGVRYVPTCNFQANQVLTPETYGSANSFLASANFKTTVNYEFNCESLRPLSISYALMGDGAEKVTGNIAGSTSGNVDVNSVVHGYQQGALKLKSLNGAVGFQAIKPGCQMRVEALMSYPDPSYFKALVSGMKQLDATLAFLASVATPSADYVTAINAIDNTKTMLIFQRDMAFDPLMADMIQTTINELTAARNTLASNCSANSSSSYCSQALANTRDAIAGLVSSNDSDMSTVKNYLSTQVAWLSGSSADLRGDEALLREALNQL